MSDWVGKIKWSAQVAMAANRRGSPVRKRTQVMRRRNCSKNHTCARPRWLWTHLDLHLAGCFSSSRYQLECYFLREAHPDHLMWTPCPPPPSLPISQFWFIFFFALITRWTLFLLTCLLSPECNNHVVRGYPFSLDPQSLEYILAQSRSSANICSMKNCAVCGGTCISFISEAWISGLETFI